jgi:hypothetical protein
VQVCKLADIFDNLTDVAHLTREKRATAFHRYEGYFTRLSQSPPPKAKNPIALVRKLIEEVRATI